MCEEEWGIGKKEKREKGEKGKRGKGGKMKFPYGMSDFYAVITEGYFYVDCTDSTC